MEEQILEIILNEHISTDIDFLIATFDVDINNDSELRQCIEQLKSEI